MIAASLLVAAVVAAYASLALLSLSVSTSSLSFGGVAGKVANELGSVGWHAPTASDYGLTVINPSAAPIQASGGGTFSPIDFGTAFGHGKRAIRVGNTSAKPLRLQVAVVGDQTLGVSATFASGKTTMVVPAHQSEPVSLITNPLEAGEIHAYLKISVANSDLTPTEVPIIGSQAPESPGAVTAAAAAGGAVNLSWAPSPSSGVAGYLVYSSAAGSPFAPVGTLITGATTAVEQTGTNATPFTYQVFAVAQPNLSSLPATSAPVTTDDQAPASPTSVSLPPINVGNVSTVPVTVVLPPTSQTTDTIVVTLIDGAGNTVGSGPLPGGQGSFTVPMNAIKLADGSVYATVTAADPLGNTSQATQSKTVPKITASLPDGPTSVVPSDNPVTEANASGFSVAVATSAPDNAAGDNVTVTLATQSGSQSFTTPSMPAPPDGTSTIPVDVSTLTDGTYIVSATVTDPAGNTASTSADVPLVIDRSGPEKPTTFYIAAGPNNPAGVINAQSQSAVTIAAHFADPLEDGETITISIDHGPSIPVDATAGAQDVTLGPLDLSDIPDGTVHLEMTLTDANGNSSQAWRSNGVKETSGPSGPTSVGVPAGPDNPAGYVNAATQSAATIVAAFDAPTDPADQISLSVDGNSSFPVQPGGSDQVIWNNLDLSGFADGTLPIVVTVTDANGNSSSFSGTLIKDTQPPPAPVAAHVLGPPLDTIAPGQASCVNVGVAFNVAPDPSDTVTVTLSDGSTSVQGSAQAGDGQVTVGCIDASSLAAGSISVSVTVTDVAGNSTTMAGTTATKVLCHHSSE